MSKYEAVYFVGDNQASNRVRVDSYKTRNRGAFSGSLAALICIHISTCTENLHSVSVLFISVLVGALSVILQVLTHIFLQVRG